MSFPKISSTDARIIHLLQKNARMSNKALAAAAGIAESTCFERVRSLQKSQVIRGFHADVDPRALGRTVHALISVRLQPKTTSSVRAFQNDVLTAPEALNVWTISGADDFIVEVAVPDVETLRKFVLDVITARSDVADSRTSLVYEHVTNSAPIALTPAD
jgi:DNA-binding Lrp family transcriptional regulator